MQAEVIEVLRQCLSNLAELKAHLDSVRAFFTALHDSVDTIRNSHVKGVMDGGKDAQDEDDSETKDEIMAVRGTYFPRSHSDLKISKFL